VPPAEPNSLGDEAMVSATVTKFRRLGYSRVLVLNYNAKDCWGEKVAGISDDVAYGGLFTRNRIIELRKLLKKCEDADGVLLIGADVMDGGYGIWHPETKLTLLRLLGKIGMPVVVAGFSFKANASLESAKLFKQLPKGCHFYLRDPRSQERFHRATGLKASPSVDLAFGFTDEIPTESIPMFNNYLKWTKEIKSRNNTIVAYCPNVLLRNFMDKANNKEFLRLNLLIIEKFLINTPEACLVLLAHDSRVYSKSDNLSDDVLVSELYDNISEDLKARVYCYNLPKSAQEVEQVCKTLDFAMTGRMHFAIACLRTGSPVAAIEFQDKVTGLMSDIFQLPQLAIPVTTFADPDKYVRLILSLYSYRHQLREKINHQLPLAKINCFAAFSRFNDK
jgi:polysaccharide pyruvyl transferase WcaK-like protein